MAAALFHKRAVRSPYMLSAFASPASVPEQVSKPFSQRILEHRFVETEFGDQLLGSSDFILELLHPAHLSDAQTGELLLPAVEGLFSDAIRLPIL